jgi:hypothetical protein
VCSLLGSVKLLGRHLVPLLAFLFAQGAASQVTRNIAQLEKPLLAPGPLTQSAGTPPTDGAEPDRRPRRVALVVGNAKYSRLPQLNNSRNDAEDMCAVLKKMDFEVSCHYDIASRTEFRQVVRDFAAKLNSETVSFFYYAGHGVQINGENFLLPVSVDAKVSLDMEDDSLNLGYLLRSIESAKSSPNIVILDACRDNPFVRTGGISTGLARVDPPVGTVLVYATAPNGVAIDGNGRNGLFTKHLLARLPEPGRKLDELFQVVAEGVEREAQQFYRMTQIPYRSFSFSAGYCMAGCEDPKVLAQIQLVARQSEEAARRVQALTEENERLKRQADERASHVQSLETKISGLAREAASAGNQSASARDELTRLQRELETARVEQRASERFKAEAGRREAEIAALKEQMAALREKASQLEEYRNRIAVLERENADKTRVTEQLEQIKKQSNDAVRRVQSLMDENSRLRKQAEDRNASIAALETRIKALSTQAETTGARTSSTRAEMAQLQVALAAARADQAASEQSRQEAQKRDQEIANLRAQIVAFQDKTHQLEELKKKIIALEKGNADKSRQLTNKEADQVRTRPVIIPSF